MVPSVSPDQLSFQFYSDEESRIHDVSPSLQNHIYFLLEKRELQIDDFLHLDARSNAQLQNASQYRQPVHFRASLRKESGILLPTNWTVIPQDKGFQWYGFPIVEKTEVENRLFEIERTLSSLHDLVFEIDENGVFTDYWINDVDMLFVPPVSFLGRKIETVLGNLPWPINEKLINGFHEARSSQAKIAVEYTSPDQQQWFICRYMPVLYANKTYAGMIVVITEITRQKSLEKNLRESQEWFKALFDNSLDIVLIISRDGKITNAALSFERELGYRTMDWLNRSIHELIHPEQWELFDRAIGRVLDGEQHDLVLQLRLRNADDLWQWMELKAASGYSSANIQGIILSLRNITKYVEIEKTLQHYSDRITGMLHSITDGFIAVDHSFTITMFNSVAQQMLMYNTNLAVGANLWSLFPESGNSASYKSLHKAMNQHSTIRYEEYITSLKSWFDVSAFPYDEGLFIYFKDVTERKKQEFLLQLEKEVLEMHASSKTSLQELTHHLVAGLEQIGDQFNCAVCIVKNNLSAELLAAPSLPSGFRKFIEAEPLEPDRTSCGRAIQLRQTVIIPDVEASDLINSTKELARAIGIKAIMSIPMISSGNEVLGTFALYFRENRYPTSEETTIVSRLTHLLTMIVENKQAAEKLWISNERYLLATKASSEAIWDWDAVDQVTFWGEGFNTLFGYPSMFYTGASMNWENKIHPDDRERVLKLIGKYTSGEKKGLYKTEYQFLKADGTYALVLDKGYCLYDDSGRVIRMIGSTQDMTERKMLEEKLLQQEIHKQQQIAQTVVDVQENERAEIGKELHDNVNQLLTTAKLFLEVARNDASMQESMLKRSSDTIMNAINEIRKISRSLMPGSISDLGLISSVNDLVENINLSRQLYAEFRYDRNVEKRLKSKEKLMFFRIIQEQVNNSLKHSGASHLLISISNHRRITRLEIKDNGKGFDVQEARKKEGIGMLNIMSRAAIFNALVEINSSPGKGCHLIIDLPYSSKKTIPE